MAAPSERDEARIASKPTQWMALNGLCGHQSGQQSQLSRENDVNAKGTSQSRTVL